MTEEFAAKISVLTIADLDAVDELMKRYSSTLGFLPRAALEDYLQKAWVLGAKDQGRSTRWLPHVCGKS